MASKKAIGAGIALDGEKEFKNAVSNINKDLSVLGSEMKKVTAQFDGNEKSIESLTAKSDVYNRQIDTQKKKIDEIKKALANSAKEYGENDAKTKNWQISLNKAEAELAKTEKALRDTHQEMNDLGKESNEAGKELEKAGKKAKDSGDNAEKGNTGWSKLGAGLSKAGALAGKALAALGTAAVTAASGLAASSVSAASYADEMLTMSTVTGISTENLQAYNYAAELVDVSMEDLTKSMAKNIKSMSSAAKGSKEYEAAYKKLGISVQNADGSLRDSEKVYWEAIDALGKVSNETERDAIAMQLFGKSAQDLNPLIAQGSDGIKQLTKEAKDMGAVMSNESLKSLGEFDDSIQRLKSGASAAKNAIGTALLPALKTISGEGVTLIGEFSKGINSANGDISKIGGTIGKTLGDLATKIADHMPEIVKTGMEIIMSLGKSIIDNLPTIIDAGIETLNALVDGLIEAIPMLLDGALTLIMSLADGLVQSLPTMIPKLVEIIIYIVETLVNNIDKILDAAIEIIVALADGIVDAIPLLVEKIPIITIKVVNAIIKAIPKLLAVVPRIFTSLVDTFKKTDWASIGKNILDGVMEGLKNAVKNIGNAVKSIGNTFLNTFKSVFGIKSPSRVFRDQVGKYLADGLGVGFTDEMDKVTQDMTKAIPTNFDTTINSEFNNPTLLPNGQQRNGEIYNVINIDGRSFASVITPYVSKRQYTALGGAF